MGNVFGYLMGNVIGDLIGNVNWDLIWNVIGDLIWGKDCDFSLDVIGKVNGHVTGIDLVRNPPLFPNPIPLVFVPQPFSPKPTYGLAPPVPCLDARAEPCHVPSPSLGPCPWETF